MDDQPHVPPPPRDGYEFTAAENHVIQATGRRVKLWGIFTLSVGTLTALLGLVILSLGFASEGMIAFLPGMIYGLLSLIPIFIGIHFIRAGGALGAVVATEGSDIGYLMDAITSLGKAFLIQIVMATIWVVIFLLAVIAAVAVPAILGG